MRKLNKLSAVLAGAALAVTIGVPVAISHAQTEGEGPKMGQKRHGRAHARRGRGPGGGGAFRGIDLSDAQKAEMKRIHESSRTAISPIAQQVRALRMEIRQASQSGTFNEALVAQKLTEIAPLEAKLMGERFRVRQETLSVLTAEQKTQLEERRGRMKSRMSERRARKSTTNQ